MWMDDFASINIKVYLGIVHCRRIKVYSAIFLNNIPCSYCNYFPESHNYIRKLGNKLIIFIGGCAENAAINYSGPDLSKDVFHFILFFCSHDNNKNTVNAKNAKKLQTLPISAFKNPILNFPVQTRSTPFYRATRCYDKFKFSLIKTDYEYHYLSIITK